MGPRGGEQSTRTSQKLQGNKVFNHIVNLFFRIFVLNWQARRKNEYNNTEEHSIAQDKE